MPAISHHSNILVTGASGFIAAHVVQVLIDRGHSVVGTVRSASKGEYLKKIFGDKFTYVIVEDMESPGAYDDALQLPLDGVIHVASPVFFDVEDPADIIGPAVRGTIGILESTKKYGTNVKRVVITSSTSAMNEPKESYPYTYTEADWNNFSADLVAREGKDAPGFHKYQASKVLSERAAWSFVETNKDSVKFDVATILPPETFGPIIHEVKDFAHLNTTSYVLYTILTNRVKEKSEEFPNNIIDVRDCALGHVLALEVEAAGGERFIVSNGPFTWKSIVDEARAAGFTETSETSQVQGPPAKVFDGTKAAKILGLNYRTVRETVVDAILSLRERFPGSF